MEQYTYVRLHAREGEENGVEEALRQVTGPTREEAGCLSFHTFRSIRDRRLFFIYCRWGDAAAFPRHAELPNTVRFPDRVGAPLEPPRAMAPPPLIGCSGR